MESSARRLQLDHTRYGPVKSHARMGVKPCILAVGVLPFRQFLLRTGRLFNLRQDRPATALGKKVRGLETGLDTEVLVSALPCHGSCQDHAYARAVGSAMRCQCGPNGAYGLAGTQVSLCKSGSIHKSSRLSSAPVLKIFEDVQARSDLGCVACCALYCDASAWRQCLIRGLSQRLKRHHAPLGLWYREDD